jgi:hypothetical protein
MKGCTCLLFTFILIQMLFYGFEILLNPKLKFKSKLHKLSTKIWLGIKNFKFEYSKTNAQQG